MLVHSFELQHIQAAWCAAAASSDICCHWPSIASFHRVTVALLSDTARMPPVTDQLSFQTGCPKSCKTCSNHQSVNNNICCMQTAFMPAGNNCKAFLVALRGQKRPGPHLHHNIPKPCPAQLACASHNSNQSPLVSNSTCLYSVHRLIVSICNRLLHGAVPFYSKCCPAQSR